MSTFREPNCFLNESELQKLNIYGNGSIGLYAFYCCNGYAFDWNSKKNDLGYPQSKKRCSNNDIRFGFKESKIIVSNK